MHNDNNQKNPTEDEIKHILKLIDSEKYTSAEKIAKQQIAKYSNSSILFNILGVIFFKQNLLNQAVENYNKAIKINPNYAQAYNNLGATLHKRNKISDAINSFKKATSLKPNFAEPFNNLGNIMFELGNFEEALSYFERTIEIKPDFEIIFANLGKTYLELGKKKEALDNFKKALKLKQDSPEIYNNIGVVYSALSRFDESLLSFKKAIELKPNHEKAYNNLGNLLNSLGRHDESSRAYHKAIKIKPDYSKAYSNLLFNLIYKTDFDPKLFLLEAKKFRKNCKSINNKIGFHHQYEKNPKKLRLGLVSSDFGNHPGGHFTLSTLRELSKKNFELIAYSSKDRKDEFSHHFKPLFSKWHSIEKKRDREVVEQIYKDGIHILMDMQGHSANNRLPIFIYKPAPIQATWLGQGTTGISEIDYFVGSPHITPKSEEKYYVEKILRLPEISQCFTVPDFDMRINELPALKNKFITFGCANKISKINDHVISLWAKILISIKNSKLLLKTKELDDQKIVENILFRFAQRNIGNDRLILKGKSKNRKDLLEIYNDIDIALDPFPFQGVTTTTEAIWMGVPVITIKGDRYLTHFGESINSNINMHNWIAKNDKEYISKAIKFASDFHDLSKIRMNLRQIALKSPLFDATRFSKHFSDMLWKMWKEYINK